MKIRYAALSDALALSQLLAQTWKTAYRGIFPDRFLDHLQEEGWVDYFTQTINSPETTILVAQTPEPQARIVAMISFGKGRNTQIAPAEIYALNVLPAFQQQNIGSTLLKRALEKLAGEQVYLHVATENHSAQAFYRKHGFCNSQIQQTKQIADFTFQEWIFLHSRK